MLEIEGITGIELLTRSPNGAIYRGTEADLDREVAVKVMRLDQDGAARRFERERRAMGRLSGTPNVAPIHRVGRLDGGELFLVMPLYVSSLQHRIDEEGPLAIAEATRTIATISKAIAAAHGHDVLHLDVKPSNILLDGAGVPYIADFGIAELTDASSSLSGVMMTPHYSAPERFEDTAPTASADVYSLAATLFTLLTGSPPFATTERVGPAAVMMKIVRDDAPIDRLPPETPKHVVAAIEGAMSKDPAVRPTPSEFAVRLEGAQTVSRVSAAAVEFGLQETKPNEPAPAIALEEADTVVRQSSRTSPVMTPVEAESRKKPWLPFALVGLVVVVGLLLLAAQFIGGEEDNETATAQETAAMQEISTEGESSTTASLTTTRAPATTEAAVVAETTTSTTAAPEPTTMWQALNDSGEAGQFAAMGAGLALEDSLEGVDPPKRTLFAPSDAALAALDPSVINELASDPTVATALFGYHILPDSLSAADLVALDGQSVDSVSGLPLSIFVDNGDVVINGTSRVIGTDFTADNGIVHIIDTVLDPPVVNALLGLENIEFEVISSVITADGQAELIKAVEFFTENPKLNAQIEAYTDTDGDADANLRLSQRRAEAVVAFLVENGLDGDRFTPVGFGENQPILVDGAENKAASRRIEFVVR